MVSARERKAAQIVRAESVERFAAQVATRGTRIWLAGDADFPIRDAEYYDEMPRALLAEGRRVDALTQPRVAIVGTRAATPIGLTDAYELAGTLARAGVTIVSGLAIGIDGAAHEGALDAGGLTVGVVATGLDVEYPRRHRTLFTRVREQGMVTGEHDFGAQPLPWRFPIRNRIIAALADAVVVVEATQKGGARITANYAGDFNRKLFAVPGSRRNPAAVGCNELIANGALPVLDPEEVLIGVGLGGQADAAWQPAPEITDADEGAVLHAFAGHGATNSELAERTGFRSARLGTALRGLETARRITRARGKWWPA
jgi:DNA processing protein